MFYIARFYQLIWSRLREAKKSKSEIQELVGEEEKADEGNAAISPQSLAESGVMASLITRTKSNEKKIPAAQTVLL